MINGWDLLCFHPTCWRSHLHKCAICGFCGVMNESGPCPIEGLAHSAAEQSASSWSSLKAGKYNLLGPEEATAAAAFCCGTVAVLISAFFFGKSNSEPHRVSCRASRLAVLRKHMLSSSHNSCRCCGVQE